MQRAQACARCGEDSRLAQTLVAGSCHLWPRKQNCEKHNEARAVGRRCILQGAMRHRQLSGEAKHSKSTLRAWWSTPKPSSFNAACVPRPIRVPFQRMKAPDSAQN